VGDLRDKILTVELIWQHVMVDMPWLRSEFGTRF